jgi:hypothetical protein
MTARRFFSPVVLATTLAFAAPTFAARKPANAPKNATDSFVHCVFSDASFEVRER